MSSSISFIVVVLALLAHQVAALYTSSDKVVSLTPSNFNDKVIKSNDFWLVEFYAPWCGHCKNLAPEWKKAAEALDGIFNIGAVDAEAHQSLATPYDVKGFPTIKFFGTNKSKPVDYQGQRTASAIVDWVLQQLKSTAQSRLSGGKSSGGGSSSSKGSKSSGGGGGAGGNGKVITLTDSNFDELVLGSGDGKTWFVEFYAPWCGHCKQLEPEWKKAAAQLGDAVNVAAVDATVHSSLAQRYGIRGYPTIKIFKEGKDNPTDYNGPRTADAIVSEGKKYGTIKPAVAKPVVQLNSEADFTANCAPAAAEDGSAGGSNICMVAFLPNILDTTAAERNSLIEVQKELAKKFASKPFTFVWVEAGAQYDVEQSLGGFSMYPTLVAVNVKKARYAPLVGAFNVETISGFVNRLGAGREPTVPLPANRPALTTTTAWDGKDAPKAAASKDDIDIGLDDIIGGK